MKHLSLPSPATSRIPTLRCLLCLGLLLLLVPLAAEAQRKKVGVVLSGGGAERRGTHRRVASVGGSGHPRGCHCGYQHGLHRGRPLRHRLLGRPTGQPRARAGLDVPPKR